MPGHDESTPEQPADGSGWATYEPSAPAPEVVTPPAPTYPGYDPAVPTTLPRAGMLNGGGAGLVVALIVMMFVGVIGVVVFASVGGEQFEQEATFDSGPAVGAPVVEERREPQVLRAEGFTELLDVVEASTGDTVVFRAVLYPTYASLDVPVDVDTNRRRSMFWNGELQDDLSRGTSLYDRVDLADVDVTLLQRLVRRASARVEDPTSTYVIIEGASRTFDEEPRILAYASNEFSEGAYVAAGLDGTIVRVVDF